MPKDPLHDLARHISARVGLPVPRPGGAQSSARAMLVLRDPGSTPETGASKTGWLDPARNSDRSATIMLKLYREAGLDQEICTYWNASPWHVGKNPIDVYAGAKWLREAIAACPELRVVVAMGIQAHQVADRARIGSQEGDPQLVRTWHPAQRGRGSRERRAEQVEALRHAAEIVAAEI